MGVKYLHMLDKQPAYFDGRRVVPMTPTSRCNFLSDSLKQCRAAMIVSIAWYRERNIKGQVPNHHYLPVRVK
jgi:hypothetical protein